VSRAVAESQTPTVERFQRLQSEINALRAEAEELRGIVRAHREAEEKAGHTREAAIFPLWLNSNHLQCMNKEIYFKTCFEKTNMDFSEEHATFLKNEA
jgi:hypothetical protein